jgi:phage protein D/phage baseplate assembly protein gpV
MSEPFFAPRFAIRVSGVTMSADVSSQVLNVAVETSLDVAGKFAITLRNPDNSLLDSALFDLGKTVEVHLGYGNDLEPASLGEITAIEPEFPADESGSSVVVTGADKSHRLRRSQPEATTYEKTSDSVIAARIAVENGLVPVVDPTPPFLDKVNQTTSDMAFLKSRAEQYFFDVYVEWDRLHFGFPRPKTAAHVLEWGRNLSSFSPRISAAGLAGLQIIRDYNQELAQSVFGIAMAADFDTANLEEKLGSAAMDLLSSLTRNEFRKGKVSNPFDATTLAKSLLADLLDGMYEGTGSCVGIPDLAAGDYIAIEGVGKRFSGTYRLRKVKHVIGERGFHTTFEIAQADTTSLVGMLRKYVDDLPSPNKEQSFSGVIVAEVVDNNEFADAQVPIGRVKVKYPRFGGKSTSGWAPCVSPMTGAGMGFYALPEKGDQVLVAFEGGDLNQPYVIGGLWHARAKPPETNSDGKNSKRVIRSRAGHKITFDDTADVGKLTVEDGKGSVITLDATNGNVTISAKNNLAIKAGGNISLEAAGGATKITMDQSQVNVT